MDGVLERLERDWLAARKTKSFRQLGEILKICSKHCADEKGIKRLGKWVEFLEENVNNIPLKDLSKILSNINYARSTIAKARASSPGDAANGKYLSSELTALYRRTAARTLNNPMVRNLKNDQSEAFDDTDLALERRTDSLDLE